jgi:hypothetical protein
MNGTIKHTRTVKELAVQKEAGKLVIDVPDIPVMACVVVG